MSAWPHIDIPGAGLLDECELDTACWRKRAIYIEPVHAAAMDECADWAARQRPDCVGDCETAAGCSCCSGACQAPQACEQPENLSGFPLEPLLARHAWLGPVLLTLIGFVWLCLDGYLEALQ